MGQAADEFDSLAKLVAHLGADKKLDFEAADAFEKAEVTPLTVLPFQQGKMDAIGYTFCSVCA